MQLNGRSIRADFPILAQEVYGRPLVFLDSAASSQKPVSVIRALQEYYERYNANVHRGLYRLSEQATERYDQARKKVAAFIGAEDPDCCLFTRGTTESINLVAYTWAEENVGPGDDLVLTAMEHHANLVPWQQLALRKGANLRWIEVTDEGTLDLSNLDELLSGRPRLVAVTWVSNVFGTINPVAEIARRARAAGAVVLVDGAQGVPHLPCRVSDLGCDFFAFSGHKMLGPMGIGVLWGRREILEEMRPFHFGGDMILQVTREKTLFNELPWKFEAGTPNVAGAIGLGAAVDYLQQVGMENVRRHERELLRYALERLGALKGMRLFGPRDLDIRSGVVSFLYRHIHPHDMATLLDRQGICVRAGHHCAQPLMQRLGFAGTTRASFYLYNTLDDVERLARGVERASEVFSGVLPV